MPNIILTPSVIAHEGLRTLLNTMVMGQLVRHDCPAEGEYHNVGDTITVPRPTVFTVGDAIGMSPQDINEKGLPVTIDRHRGLSFTLTAKEAALTLREYRTKFIKPAMDALAQDIDSYLCGLYAYLPYYSVEHATTVTIGDIADLAAAMTVSKVPLDQRQLVLDPLSAAKYKVLPAILDASQKGDARTINTNELGSILRFNTWETQNVKTAGTTVGSLTGCTTPATVLVDAETMLLTDTDATPGLIPAGTLFTINGDTQVYSITKDATQTALGCIIYFSPGLKVAITSGKAVTVGAIIGDGKTESVAFHKECFTLVTIAPATPISVPSEVLTLDGVSIRVTYDWDRTNLRDVVSFDCMWGARCLDPELGRRFRGQ
jgi:hypothetical protein